MNSTSTPSALNQDDVSARARQLWESAGSPSDRDLEFWLAAETALRREQDTGPRPLDNGVGQLPATKRATARRR